MRAPTGLLSFVRWGHAPIAALRLPLWLFDRVAVLSMYVALSWPTHCASAPTVRLIFTGRRHRDGRLSGRTFTACWLSPACGVGYNHAPLSRLALHAASGVALFGEPRDQPHRNCFFSAPVGGRRIGAMHYSGMARCVPDRCCATISASSVSLGWRWPAYRALVYAKLKPFTTIPSSRPVAAHCHGRPLPACITSPWKPRFLSHAGRHSARSILDKPGAGHRLCFRDRPLHLGAVALVGRGD